jgi:hypothetical protein
MKKHIILFVFLFSCHGLPASSSGQNDISTSKTSHQNDIMSNPAIVASLLVAALIIGLIITFQINKYLSPKDKIENPVELAEEGVVFGSESGISDDEVLNIIKEAASNASDDVSFLNNILKKNMDVGSAGATLLKGVQDVITNILAEKDIVTIRELLSSPELKDVSERVQFLDTLKLTEQIITEFSTNENFKNAVVQYVTKGGVFEGQGQEIDFGLLSDTIKNYLEPKAQDYIINAKIAVLIKSQAPDLSFTDIYEEITSNQFKEDHKVMLDQLFENIKALYKEGLQTPSADQIESQILEPLRSGLNRDEIKSIIQNISQKSSTYLSPREQQSIEMLRSYLEGHGFEGLTDQTLTTINRDIEILNVEGAKIYISKETNKVYAEQDGTFNEVNEDGESVPVENKPEDLEPYKEESSGGEIAMSGV